MVIKRAAAEDTALISAVIAKTWRGAYGTLIDPVYLSRLPDGYWTPSVRGWLESGRMYGLIAEEGGAAVGCILYGRGRDEAYGDWGEIVSLYVLPEAMGCGVGGALLDQALADLREDGFDRVYLWMIEGNDRAARFYARRGFAANGEKVDYKIGCRPVTDVLLTRKS